MRVCLIIVMFDFSDPQYGLVVSADMASSEASFSSFDSLSDLVEATSNIFGGHLRLPWKTWDISYIEDLW